MYELERTIKPVLQPHFYKKEKGVKTGIYPVLQKQRAYCSIKVRLGTRATMERFVGARDALLVREVPNVVIGYNTRIIAFICIWSCIHSIQKRDS